MAFYEYSLADDLPEEYSKTITSNELVGVWNGTVSYGVVNYDGTGRIGLDLPDEVVKKLNHGILKIQPQFQRVLTPIDQPDSGKLEITRLDVVAGEPEIVSDLSV
jgi:hypothetical protein